MGLLEFAAVCCGCGVVPEFEDGETNEGVVVELQAPSESSES